MKAIKEEKLALARILIKCPRVDLGIKDGNGSSLQKIARYEGNRKGLNFEFVEFLLNRREKGFPELIELICDALSAKNEQLQEEKTQLQGEKTQLQEEKTQLQEEKTQLNNSILEKIPECPVNIKLYFTLSDKFPQCFISQVCLVQFQKDRPIYGCPVGHHICDSCKPSIQVRE